VVDPETTLSIFPFTTEATSLLLRIFELEPERRIKLPELVEKAKKIKRWSIQEVERAEGETDATSVDAHFSHWWVSLRPLLSSRLSLSYR